MLQDAAFKAARSTPAKSTAVTVCAADVAPQEISWLWRYRLALGKLSIIIGDPGLFKSGLVLSLGATVTRGALWPDGSGAAPLGNVILLSAEDDIGDTIRPRLDAAEADVSRVHVLTMIVSLDDKGQPTRRGFSLAEDLEALDALLTRLPETRLVIVDPISAYLGGSVDSHNNSEIRGILAPLAELAARRKVAVLAVSHLNKGGQLNALYRASGSLAFVAAARSVYLVARDPNEPTRRLFLPIKNNLAPELPGLAYSVVESPRGGPMIAWHPEPVHMDASEALMQPSEGHARQRGDAGEWLRQKLQSGPVPSNELKRLAAEAGIAWRTLNRAKGVIGARSCKDGEQWVWRLE
jgi:hypothetical protein